MIRVYLLSPLLIICILASCGTDTNSEHGSDFFLVQAKDGLNAYIDSANFYCDKVILESKMGTKKEVLIAEYGPKIKFYENTINEAFDRAAILSKQKQLHPGVYERWLDGFNLKQLADKNKKLAAIGIDLSYIPAENVTVNSPSAAVSTDNINLPQIYSDRKKSFNINLPKDWVANEKEQEGMTTIMAGPGNSNTVKNAAIGVNIMNFTKELSTDDFYYGNIALIKNNSKNFILIEETEMNINGIKAKYAVFSCINKGISISSVQAYFFLNKKGYILNGTSASDHFNEYKDLYIAIIKSFKIQNGN